MARLEELSSLLAAGRDPVSIGKTLMILLAAFPAQSLSEEIVAARIAGYRIALDDMPAWAVEEAAKMWLRGSLPEAGQYAPAPPVLRRTAAALLAKVQNERAGYERLLYARLKPVPATPICTKRAKELVKGSASSPCPPIPSTAGEGARVKERVRMAR